MAKRVKECEVREAMLNYEGYCTHCEDFTRMETEPDARNYNCPQCHQNTVMGAEEAVLMGFIYTEEE